MPGQSKRYLLLFLITISAIGALTSAIVVLFASQNELSLQEAINTGQVTATIRGTADEGRYFKEPMLEVTLTNETLLPLTIIIPQITLEGPVEHADVVSVQPKKMTLAWFRNRTELYAYSLDYHDSKFFPHLGAEYRVKSTSIREELIQVLNNVVALEAENDFSSQLAVWHIYQNQSLTQIGDTLGKEYSNNERRVNDILESDSAPPSPDSVAWPWWDVLILSSFLTTLRFVVMLRRQPNVEHKSSDGDRLIDHLGDWEKMPTGGMAEVYAAYDKRSAPARKLIVKFPLTNTRIPPENISHRFNTEVEQQKKLHSIHIPRLIEDGRCMHPFEGGETQYLIQEFVDGCTLKELLEERNHEKLDDVIIHDIVSQIMMALSYIHSKNVVHRDLSWNNIMIERTSGHVYLIDFGNATKFYSEITGVLGHHQLGTRPFAAPNYFEHVEARDYFSLSILIYALYADKEYGKASNNQEIANGLKKLVRLGKQPEWIFNLVAWFIHVCDGGEYKDVSKIKEPLDKMPRYQLAQMAEETMRKKEEKPGS